VSPELLQPYFFRSFLYLAQLRFLYRFLYRYPAVPQLFDGAF